MKRQTVRTTKLAGNHKTYAAALAACKSPAFADGGASPAIADAFRTRLQKAAATSSLNPDRSIRLMPYLTALALCRSDGDLGILDVGGDTGLFYHYIRVALGSHLPLHYDVLEAPEIAKVGRQACDKPRYFGDPGALEKYTQPYDLIVFGGVLQILPDPEAFMRRVLAAAPSQYVLITTMPRIDQYSDRVTIKQLGAASHPYWLFGARWRKVFSEIGEVVMSFEMPTFRFQVDGGEPQPQWGYIIRRSATPEQA